MQAIRVPVMDLDFGQELQLVDCWDTCLETQVVAVLITVITITMGRGTTDDGLGTDLVDPAGLGPITPGLLVGPQAAVTGVALPLRAPGPPQALVVPSVAKCPEDSITAEWAHCKALSTLTKRHWIDTVEIVCLSDTTRKIMYIGEKK